MNLTLTITVPDEGIEAVTDALNETLNALALVGVLDDTNDDAWAWNN